MSAAITSSEVRYFDFEATLEYRAISEKPARVGRSPSKRHRRRKCPTELPCPLASPARLRQRFISLGDGRILAPHF